jgi:hypothetical protein
MRTHMKLCRAHPGAAFLSGDARRFPATWRAWRGRDASGGSIYGKMKEVGVFNRRSGR